MSLEQAIKNQAHQIGFQLAGITTCAPPEHYTVFESWLQAGMQADMAYLSSERSRHRRADPTRILPGCRSIVSLATCYAPAGSDNIDNSLSAPTGTPALRGRLASYAWGKDYHLVLPQRLEQLAGFIQERLCRTVGYRYYSDTGPLLERDLAQRAGLGWIGKNTCLINPHTGSYFFLAELLLDIELDPDPPFSSDQCGNCTRCLDACPTACILPDRTIDASRCISYLTIELKGAIPLELRQSLGDWIFGCDICQQVCPWNQRFAPPAGDAAFLPRTGVPYPDLLAEMALSGVEFKHKFSASPVLRSKRRGYLRNVAVALTHQAKKFPAVLEHAITTLQEALLEDQEPLVRGHAAWSLGTLKQPRARQSLAKALQTEVDPYVLEEIRNALTNTP